MLGGRCVLYGIVLTGGITGCLGGEDDCCAAVADADGAAAAGGVVFTGACFSSSLSSTQQEKELILNVLEKWHLRVYKSKTIVCRRYPGDIYSL